MEPLHLDLGEVLQGDASLRTRTVVLVFQVNCPGCFLYALPTAEAIHQERDRLGLSVLAVSTAFEDFSLNTVENTRALVDHGTLVGETKRHLGMSRYPGTLSFSIATDAGMATGVGRTFAVNALMGTPSWIVIEPDGRILDHQLGELRRSRALLPPGVSP